MKYLISILTLCISLNSSAQTKGQFPELLGHTLEGTAITLPLASTKKFTM